MSSASLNGRPQAGWNEPRQFMGNVAWCAPALSAGRSRCLGLSSPGVADSKCLKAPQGSCPLAQWVLCVRVGPHIVCRTLVAGRRVLLSPNQHKQLWLLLLLGWGRCGWCCPCGSVAWHALRSLGFVYLRLLLTSQDFRYYVLNGVFFWRPQLTALCSHLHTMLTDCSLLPHEYFCFS